MNHSNMTHKFPFLDVSKMQTLTKPPLRFIGSKKNYRKQYLDVLLKRFDDSYVYVDLFGGSGFLSYLTKKTYPNARVIYNDFDNYSERLQNIPTLNVQLQHIRTLIGHLKPKEKVPDHLKDAIIEYLQTQAYVDMLSISSFVLFTNVVCRTVDELRNHSFYNRAPKHDIPECNEYLQGLEIRCEDFQVLIDEFKRCPRVVFIVDPPYFASIKHQYTGRFWNWCDFIKIIDLLISSDRWLYFTNKESETLELLQYIDKLTNGKIDMQNIEQYEQRQVCGCRSVFHDIMMVRS